MHFTLLLGISAAVSALPLDGPDKNLLSESTSTGPKLPLYIIFNSGAVTREIGGGGGTGDILERSPLPEADEVAVNVAN
ncbi:hypothetical protein E4U13_002461 [Claviceps humidiphila]|uniref:Uncharacterized protein n=1 Tax=Claviceps humidiphila TaxID=1294629 RepID=A0A9P7Q129_9HYPO|nr:hypothetical protein E4U13_002461 [Claviceps humidiphila]